MYELDLLNSVKTVIIKNFRYSYITLIFFFPKKLSYTLWFKLVKSYVL